jgi:hypothetical protein
MHAGLFRTYLMALMIRSKLSLKLVFVPGLWNSSCTSTILSLFVIIALLVCQFVFICGF